MTQLALCSQCFGSPEFKLIYQTNAFKKYGVTRDQLLNAWKRGEIRKFSKPNHITNKGMCNLYYEKEVKSLADRLGATPSSFEQITSVHVPFQYSQ